MAQISYGPTALAAVNVTNFQDAATWFKDMLGFELDYSLDDMGWGEVKTGVPGFTIGVQQVEQMPHAGGGATITLSVTDIDSARAYLEGNGVRFDGETTVIPEMVKLATFFDPDGNSYMFAQSLQA